jgi:ferric enterobactin receptor
MKGRLLLFVFGLIFISNQALAQRTISGKVTNPKGVGLGNVTIQEKGKSLFAVTTTEGNFQITVSPDATLVFRYIGFITVEKKVGSENVLNVTLKEDLSTIDEVVVTAHGIDRDKKSLGYSTPVVSGEEVAETQRVEFFNGLQGRVPGLTVNSSSGLPGASAQIVLRGFISISGDNNALIVVDGVPIDNSTLSESDLAFTSNNQENDYSNRGIDLNPDDIESYVIMKGPEATALFGNQGAGGAILITTKKGKVGRVAVNYNYAGRVEYVNKFPERQYVYSNGLSGNYDGTSSYAFGPKYPEGIELFKKNINNFFRTGFNHKHNVGIEGGTSNITYRWSGEYTDNTGIVPNTRYTRAQTRLNSSIDISSKVKFNTSISYMFSDNDKARRGQSSYMYTLLRFNPLYDVRDWIDPNGNRVLHTGTIYTELDNPFWDAYRNISFDKVNRSMANGTLTYTPNKWLTFTGIMGIDYSTTHGENVYHAQSFKGSGNSDDDGDFGEITMYDRSARIINGTFTARSRHKFNDFSLTAVLGSNFNDYLYETNSQYGRNFSDPNFYSINVTNPDDRMAVESLSQTRNVGFFAQTVWGYKSLLYMTLSGRMDGSSRLMPNTPWFAYPSGSLAFNFTDLDYFKDIKWISDGKIRASISLTGKQPLAPYFTLSKYKGQTSSGGGLAYDVNGGSPDLKPETTEDKEFGVEFALFKKRLTIDFTRYSRISRDQIFRPRLSYGTGFILKMLNGGTVKSDGIEVQAKVSAIRKQDFNWDITFNFTKNQGKVVSLADALPETYDSDTWIFNGIRSGAAPGYSIGNLMATDYKRNDKGEMLINATSGLPILGSDIYYPIGDRIPDFTLGTINKFRYKKFSTSFLWDLRVGGDVLNGLEYRMNLYGLSDKTLNRENPRILNGVWEDGLENTDNPTRNNIAVTPYYNSAYYNNNTLSRSYLERDIWTFRLRDITLSYELPKSLTSRVGKNTSLSVFCTAVDVVLFTNYTGIDPETNSNNASLGGVGGFGIDGGSMGKPRAYNFGVRLKL